jgi:hypothetical protein
MKRLILAAIRCSLIFLLPSVTYALSAQWDLDPISGDWNTAANWTPMGVPSGPTDIATFAVSNTTNVSISAQVEVNSIVFDSGATKSYTITVNPGLTLIISGVGITNNSGIRQNFFATAQGGQILFTNSGTAGSTTSFTNSGGMVSGTVGGFTQFYNSSTAANGTFTNNGGTVSGSGGSFTLFFFTSTAANGTFTNNGGTASGSGGSGTEFFNSSTAGNGTFTNNGGTASDAGGGSTFFSSSTAGNGTFTNNGGTNGAFSGRTEFGFNSTAGNGTFTNNGGTASDAGGGSTLFSSSTAGNGTFTNNGGTAGGAGGSTIFFSSSTAGNGTFFNNGGVEAGGGHTDFLVASTAGNGTFINNGGTAGGAGGYTNFLIDSTAGNGTFINNGSTAGGGAGSTIFSDSSTAGNGTFTNKGGATFFDGSSTAGNGTFMNNGATVVNGVYGSQGLTEFFVISTAGNGTFINNGGTFRGAAPGFTSFRGSSTAGNGTFINNGGTVSGASGGLTHFAENSSANAATLIANGGAGGGTGGRIGFGEFSTGDTSRVEVFGNGNLDISSHSGGGVTVGSIEGDGTVFLGANTLTVGSNNLSTTLSGVIQDGGQNGGVGGSLTKIGTGTLDLTGANTYSGDTNINGGVLKVDGSITSNTFVNAGGTLAGMGVVHGNVTNNGGTVSPGDSPGALTVTGTYTQQAFATLMIEIAGTSAGDFSVLNVLGTASLNGILDPFLLNGFVPAVGDQFTFLNYASFSGAFRLQDCGIFNNGTERWVVTYQPTFAVLTATENVPDQGSTFLLLTLGLLGLVTFRRQLLRGQP